MITVHYHRFDNDYEGIGLWTWAPEGCHSPEHPEHIPAGWDNYGPYFEIDPAEFFGEGEERPIGLLPRLRHDWRFKDGEDRFWVPRMGHEVWLIGGDAAVYTRRPDTSPRVQNAFLDDEHVLTIKLSHSVELSKIDKQYCYVRQNGSSEVSIHSVHPVDARDGRARILEIKTSDSLDETENLMVSVRGYKPARVVWREVLLDPEKYLYDGKMGAVYSPEATTFRLFSPEADSAQVILYDSPSTDEGRKSHPMKPIGQGAWEARVEGDLHGRSYRVRVQSRDPQTGREVPDPYSLVNTGHDGHGMVADVRRFDPEGFRPIERPAPFGKIVDAVIWEVHVRDFTIDPSAGVPEEQRGKYTGAAVRGTTLPGTDLKTGIDHLVELGVTHVQILPIQDFDNEEDSDQYNWGYMPNNFFSPDGWYASNIRDGSRVRETKEMIRAFHRAGIRVILDVVFNHTSPMASFEPVAPRYYHRRKDDGSFWNGSGCGNEFRSEAPMARKLIIDACRYWVEEYGVDGFRFDLMGLIDLDTMKAVRNELVQIDENILVYGEPWTATPPEETGIKRVTSKFMITGTGVAAFNDHFRDDLKGSPDGPGPGYVQSGARREGVKRGIQGAIFDWTWHPTDAVQYVTCHDNLTLWDKLKASAPDASEEELLHMQMLALGILMVSQGGILLHGGAEMARTKGGNPNTYDSPDSVNKIDWNWKKKNEKLFHFVRGMIALRREHPVFHLPSREEIQSRLHFLEKHCYSEKMIIFTIFGGGLEGEPWNEALVMINPEDYGADCQLPKGEWGVHAIGEKVSPAKPLDSVSDRLVVPRRSLAVLGK